MKLKSSLVAPVLAAIFIFLFFIPVSKKPPSAIRRYIQETFPCDNATGAVCLTVTETQIEQLSWVLENPVITPEFDIAGQRGIHMEVPRALSRLYSLQLLRSGTQADYIQFVFPQRNKHQHRLPFDKFLKLAKIIQGLDNHSYAVLEATAIISSVVLSPRAKTQAAKVLNKVPEDNNQFLAATAQYARQIYPLAQQVIGSNPERARRFQVVFLADSHLRHMMYAEGSQAMYSQIKQGLADKTLSWCDLDLWFAHWMINVAGFRGHIDPRGSLYLTLPTFQSMKMVWKTLLRITSDSSANPMLYYLEQCSRKLRLKEYLDEPDQKLAVALLSAQTRVYTPRTGKLLVNSFLQLSDENRRRWITHAKKQLKVLDEPAATYVPALFANMIRAVGLEKAVLTIVPVILDACELAEGMRQLSLMAADVPLSFRELARKEIVKKLSTAELPIKLTIEPDTGIIRFHP